MTIRNKTIVIISITFLMLIVILYIVIGSVFQRSFTQLEKQDTSTNVGRALNILFHEIDTLDSFNWDWSSWDDTYAFIEDSNEEYVKSNLVDSTFTGVRLNLMLFINSSNQIVFGKAFDLEEEREIPIPEDLQEHLLPNSLLTKHSDSSVKGIILLSEAPMLVTSRPILTSEDEGPIRGSLIMGRYLNSAEIERLAEISHLTLNIQKFNDSQISSDFQKAFFALSEENPIFIQPLNDELVGGYALIKDIYGKPILVLRVDIPRDIYRQGQVTRRYFIFSILAISMIFSLLVLVLLNRLVLSPISRVDKYLDTVTSTKDLSFRIPVKGKDEISKLSNTINLMLEKLEESRKELWDSRELYKNLFDNMPGVFYRADRDGNILLINPPGAKLLGYNSPEEIIGKNLAKDLYYIPEDRKRFLGELKKRKGSVEDYEITLKKRDDTIVVVSTSSHYCYDEEGNITGVEGIFVDITERVQAEKFQKVLYNISKAANSPISLGQLYPIIHRELGNIIDTTNFYIALVDENKDELYFPYYLDEKDEKMPFVKFSITNTLTTYVIKTGKSLLNNNEQYKEMISQGILTPMGSTTDESIWLGVPLKIEDKIMGAMAVQSYTNPNLYREADIKLMEFVSSQVAIAIKRKRTEEALRKSHQEFASLFKNIPEALAYLDKDSNIIDINPRFTELFGYTLEELKGRNLDDGMIHPPEKMKEGKWLTKKSLKGRFYYETVRKKKDGTMFPVAISGSQVIIDGQLTGLIGIFQDITERKKIEKKLEELAHYDALTSCYRRGYGLVILEQQIKTANRKKTPILLLYLDVDGFKEINDTFGHKEGDMVLKDVVQLFKSTLREVDIICRMGGDEFLLIFPESSLNEVPLIRERLSENLEKLNQKLGKPYKIDFSIGLSCYNPANPLSIDELIHIADKNMYKDKKSKNKRRL